MGNIDAPAAIDRNPKVKRDASPRPQHQLIARADNVVFRDRYSVQGSKRGRYVAKKHPSKNGQAFPVSGGNKLLKLGQRFGTKPNR